VHRADPRLVGLVAEQLHGLGEPLVADPVAVEPQPVLVDGLPGFLDPAPPVVEPQPVQRDHGGAGQPAGLHRLGQPGRRIGRAHPGRDARGHRDRDQQGRTQQQRLPSPAGRAHAVILPNRAARPGHRTRAPRCGRIGRCASSSSGPVSSG
jgi:hypothetical protein